MNLMKTVETENPVSLSILLKPEALRLRFLKRKN
jgi:hypothetical protein